MNVVVTGASSGLGKALADVFRTAGHSVIGSSHDSVAVSKDEGLIFFEAGQHATPLEPFVEEVGLRFGNSLDVLINNAGANAICPFGELTPTFVRHIMDVNFMTPVFMAQAFMKMLEGHGTIVNIISDAAWRPMRHSLAYNCSKAALNMATKQMARELTQPKSISIIGVRPGPMSDTEMTAYIDRHVQKTRGWTPEEAYNYFRQNSVSGLKLHPNDVAAFVLSIVTGGMVRQLSGSCIDLVG